MNRYLQDRFLSGLSSIGSASLSSWKVLVPPYTYRGRSIILTYHSIWGNSHSNVEFILKHGFNRKLYPGRGWGVSLTNTTLPCMVNHPKAPIMVCGIEPNPKFIQRYPSNIYTQENDSTYFVKDPSLIQPIALVRFHLDFPIVISRYSAGPQSIDCPQDCLDLAIPCRCQRLPTILPEDVVSID